MCTGFSSCVTYCRCQSRIICDTLWSINLDAYAQEYLNSDHTKSRILPLENIFLWNALLHHVDVCCAHILISIGVIVSNFYAWFSFIFGNSKKFFPCLLRSSEVQRHLSILVLQSFLRASINEHLYYIYTVSPSGHLKTIPLQRKSIIKDSGIPVAHVCVRARACGFVLNVLPCMVVQMRGNGACTRKRDMRAIFVYLSWIAALGLLLVVECMKLNYAAAYPWLCFEHSRSPLHRSASEQLWCALLS